MSTQLAESPAQAPAAPADEPILTEHSPPRDTRTLQQAWAQRPLADRLAVLRKWRHAIALQSHALTAAIAPEPNRTPADVMVSEILPLLAACRFLERNAARILKPRRLGRAGRPLWLAGVASEVHRVPLGHVLIIGPSNYPLLLPGVQVLQALVAGNSVTWKPGRGGLPVAKLVASALTAAGLPPELLTLTEESLEAGQAAIARGADKVFLTGSAPSGRALMRSLAETATPSVMELSGCSAVVVMPEADLSRVAAALAFALRFNGSATCMAPRRLLVMGPTRRAALIPLLDQAFAAIPPIHLPPPTQRRLKELVDEAVAQGATVRGILSLNEDQPPLLLLNVTPTMRIAQSDLFAPVLSVIDVPDAAAVITAEHACPFALSLSIFGEESAARRLAARIPVGSVTINDLIVPTADPRVPFGGRRASGFGVTRGPEGLLEMTAIQTLQLRRSTSQRHYQPTASAHSNLFDGLIRATHGGTWIDRLQGLRRIAKSARTLKPETTAQK